MSILGGAELRRSEMMRSIGHYSFIFWVLTSCAAHRLSQNATISVDQPKRPYHIGGVLVLKVTITNHSTSEIRFEESRRGAWEVEVYDSQSSSGEDLAAPVKKRHEVDGGFGGPRVTFSIAAGESLSDKVLLGRLHEFIPGPGIYKIILSKHEWKNNVVVRSNPVKIEITAD